MLISPSELRGRPVVDAEGVAFGDLDELYFDTLTLTVRMFRVAVRRDRQDQAGVHGSLMRKAHLDIGADKVQSVGDAIVLNVPLSVLRANENDDDRRIPQP